MKIITDSTVTIVGSTKFHPHPTYDIPDDGTDSEKLGAFSAKGCYDSYGKEGRSNTDNQIAVIESMHGSVLEHSHVSLCIEGITRGCSLELNRHRPFNISQRSTRYTKEGEGALVLEPYYADLYNKFYIKKEQATNDDERKSSELITNHIGAAQMAFNQYEKEVETLIDLNPNKLTGFDLRKWARGKARNILPHGLETRGVWTNNFRGLRWFIELRSERHAEPEIRRLTNHIFITVATLAPTYFKDFEISAIVDGIPEWKPRFSKV